MKDALCCKSVTLGKFETRLGCTINPPHDEPMNNNMKHTRT